MPSPPGAVTFTPALEKYGMLTLKDLSVENLDGGGDGIHARAPGRLIPPFRTPLQQRDVRQAEAQTNRIRETETGADLTRPWALFFEWMAHAYNQAQADAGGSKRLLHAVVLWIDEIKTRDEWARIGAVDTTDPLEVTPISTSVPRTDTAPYARDWEVGDYVCWNDPSQSGVDSGKRRYECGQITVIDSITGEWTIQRHWPDAGAGEATFGSYVEAHGDVRLYRVLASHFCYDVQKEDYIFDAAGGKTGIPRRWDIPLPSACVVAVYMAAENEFGLGDWTGQNISYEYQTSNPKLLPPAPGLRTCAGQAYLFEEPGTIAAGNKATLPIRVQDWASLRTIYGFMGTLPVNPSDGDTLKVRVKILYAADRLDGVELQDASQPWTNLEDLLWEKDGTFSDVASSDRGQTWAASSSNPPTERRMPYCEDDLLYWDPEAAIKAWPVPVAECDAWLDFEVLAVGTADTAPSDLSIVVQT